MPRYRYCACAGKHREGCHNGISGLPPLADDQPGAGAGLDALGAVWSPDFDAYASGTLDAAQVRCALCQLAPCDCPPFGTEAYFDLLDKRHGRTR